MKAWLTLDVKHRVKKSTMGDEKTWKTEWEGPLHI